MRSYPARSYRHPAAEPSCARHRCRRRCAGGRPATSRAGRENKPMADERGHLKVFIGMAPGVGKTFRMLQEGVSEADSGRDVAIGYLEPHGRAETLAQADGLELIPRREVVYRGRTLHEMDLPAVL